ncbi:CALML3 [Branchiostoma lanceolatum]|uniref:CALML3 protein n=1 Tax=Branchiostoma lanceolatum TaxID=7740 RepID=A0A8K0E9T8_BRALA|nr:CALML3 [Branchiostoma lanceolatum]
MPNVVEPQIIISRLRHNARLTLQGPCHHLPWYSLLNEWHKIQPAKDNMAEAAFNKHDVNKDGKMSSAELKAALEELNVKPSGALLQAILVQYDKAPQNGVLELNEFKNLVADMQAIQTAKREEVLDTFTTFDKDKSGFIEPGELKEVLKSLNMGNDDATVQAMMAIADTDKDGKVSITEFANIIGHGE